MKKVLITRFACVAVLAVATFAAGPVSRPAQPADASGPLDYRLVEVKFEGASVEDALKSLSQLAHVCVVANWSDLEAAGAMRGARVDFSARNVKTSEALQQVLRPAGSSARYVVERNVVYVASERETHRPAFSVGKPAGDKNANEAAERMLTRVLPGIKIDAVTLTDALDYCRDKLGVPLDVDWDALKKAGLERDMRVSVELKHVAASDLIYWILRPLPAKATILWQLKDGRFNVTTAPPGSKQ